MSMFCAFASLTFNMLTNSVQYLQNHISFSGSFTTIVIKVMLPKLKCLLVLLILFNINYTILFNLLFKC